LICPVRLPRTEGALIEVARFARAGAERGDSRDRLVFTPPDIIELTKFLELFLGILLE
jgi:hypothetical protein